mgnify:CR=1 FL=1
MRGDKREVIIDAAAFVFAREGYDRARMEDISGRAGIGKGTIYEYFKSKKDLFQSVVKHACKVYIMLIQGIDGEDRPFEEKLREYIFIYNEFLEKHRDLADLVLMQPQNISRDTRKYFQLLRADVIDATVKMLDLAESRGEIRDADKRMTAEMIWGISGTLFSTGLIENERWNVDEVVDVILHGISR